MVLGDVAWKCRMEVSHGGDLQGTAENGLEMSLGIVARNVCSKMSLGDVALVLWAHRIGRSACQLR